ncbi:MAG: PLP-dependent transferase [Anaerolineales bacterium]|nr:PLP-dependent transferase [Anaerolineales bacterium]MCB8963400.1 PLP-dependent transferase [Ardenticatenales bacterium]
MTVNSHSHEPDQTDFATRAIHAGSFAGTSAPPIYQGVNAPHPEKGVAYISEIGGVGGPTVAALQELVQEMEGAAWTVAFPAGQAAIGHTLFALLQSGDRVVAHRNIYTYATTLLREDLPAKWGVEVEWVDMRDLTALEKALQKPARLVYFEPITNPAFHLLDTGRICQLAHAAGALAVLDNTLLSPYLFQPLAAGADIVIQSATKYLCGHGDALGGVVSGNEAEVGDAIVRFRRLMGGIMAPMNAYLIMRGIRTLPVRMERHCQNALQVAQFLQNHPAVREVRYPGLADYPAPAALKAQYRGFGGILGFVVDPAVDHQAVRQRVRLGHPWGSLGDVGTLVAAPGEDPFRDIPANYLRVAVGLEAPQDIIADLDQALSST